MSKITLNIKLLVFAGIVSLMFNPVHEKYFLVQFRYH